MNRRLLLTISALLLTCGAALSLARERQVGGVGLTMFINENYRGEAVTLRNDNPNLHTVGHFQLASSLQIGPGEQWEVCDQVNYGGACLVFSGAESDLRRRGWNDRIASARRVRSEGRGRGIVPPVAPVPPATGAAGLNLYSNASFYGERQRFTSAVTNLEPLGFNDRAMSLSMGANETWEVCVHANFQDCRIVSSYVMDLTEIGMARTISSARPIRTGRGRGNVPNVPRLVLFDGREFSGASRTIERDASAIFGFGGRAESLQVLGGSWEICDRPNFGGRCITITGNLPDLSPLGFANQIQSVRLRPTAR